MKKSRIFVLTLISVFLLSGCGIKQLNDKYLETKTAGSNTAEDLGISLSCVMGDEVEWKKTKNRIDDGETGIEEIISLEILGEKYELKYDKSEWNLGVGWIDNYKTEKRGVKASFNSDTGKLNSVIVDKYKYTYEDDYVPSKENGTTIKTDEEFESLSKKYLNEIFENIDYDRYTVTKDFEVKKEKHGTLVTRNPAMYSLDVYFNGIRTGERICVEMNEYGDFVACSRKNIGAYDDLDVDYLIDTGLLTDKACEVAGETIKEKYKEYGKEVKELTYDTDKDVFCLDEDGKPIRIVYCHITLENGDTDIIQVVVGIEE